MCVAVHELRVFISHATEEKELAQAWKQLLQKISMSTISVWLSSDTDHSGGIRPGVKWRDTIGKRILESDVVLATISPRTVNRPWILWECGMAVGAKQDDRLLIPVFYSMKADDIGDPLGEYQAYAGDDSQKVMELCQRLLAEAGLKPHEDLIAYPIEEYRSSIRLYTPPRAAGPTERGMWSQRIENCIRYGRGSELIDLAQAMYASFGSCSPIDAAIHDRLSAAFLDHKQFEQALTEVESAIALSKDDLYLYHRKALIQLELGRLREAESTLDHIRERFSHAVNLPEICGIEGRLYRELHMVTQDSIYLNKAIGSYRRGYDNNQDSYYCGVNAIALMRKAGQVEEAESLATKVMVTCNRLLEWPSPSFWLDFSIAELSLFLNDVNGAIKAYQRGVGRSPSPSLRDRESALKGAHRTLLDKADVFEHIRSILM